MLCHGDACFQASGVMNLEFGVVGDVSGPLDISVNLFVLELDLLNFGFGLTISMGGGARQFG